MSEPEKRAVSLTAVLSRREWRANRQRQLLGAYAGKPLVCLLVNMPGPVKRTANSDRVFAAGVNALTAALRKAGVSTLFTETLRPETGCEAYLAVDCDAATVKRLACALEDGLPYGRLLDIDVHTPEGTQISRVNIGLPARGCMVCGAAGANCASRRLHALPEILAAFDRLAALAPEEEKA